MKSLILLYQNLKNHLTGSDDLNRPHATKYSFGATSAIITNMALIAGLYTSAEAKISIIGGLLVIALADNVSDTLGIHIYQESEGMRTRDVWRGTINNFLARLFISFGFIFIMIIFPLKAAVIISIIYGLATLIVFSYIIAKIKKLRIFFSIAEHLVIAIAVIAISNYLGKWIIPSFR
jgi:vacuolar iron transporter family protein